MAVPRGPDGVPAFGGVAGSVNGRGNVAAPPRSALEVYGASNTDVPTAGPGRARGERPNAPRSNRPLHRLTESTFDEGRNRVSLQRGQIIRIQSNASNADSRITNIRDRYRFNFLFNPEVISINTSSFAGVVDPSYRSSADTTFPRFIGQEGCSFNLMVDRTQEAYEEGIKTRGTLDDIEALYRVINGNIGSRAGFLSLSALEIHWGPHTLGGNPLPVFPCYITAVDFTHTQFTPRMCPVRTLITISAARLVSFNATGGVTSASVANVGATP